ncbi:hypothetical protein BHM03_00022609 [Ensete ventricosum]|uniref:Uncharacterized protein n=1 Tax=Ensete ventricosum TaxID=4639 RepID=A0A445MGF7_ENSVE|nr:hypothetical protein BHM03_00022609 [Ensete ventricosum]
MWEGATPALRCHKALGRLSRIATGVPGMPKSSKISCSTWNTADWYVDWLLPGDIAKIDRWRSISAVDGRLKEKSIVDGRLKEKKGRGRRRRGKEERRRGEEEERRRGKVPRPRALAARGSSRAVAALAARRLP